MLVLLLSFICISPDPQSTDMPMIWLPSLQCCQQTATFSTAATTHMHMKNSVGCVPAAAVAW
jgi:hypothetical protein